MVLDWQATRFLNGRLHGSCMACSRFLERSREAVLTATFPSLVCLLKYTKISETRLFASRRHFIYSAVFKN